MIACYKSYGSWRGEGKYSTYVYTTTQREICAYYRRNKLLTRDKHSFLVVPGDNDVYLQIGIQKSLKQVMAKLPTLSKKYRTVMELWVEGKDLPQIEAELGIKRSNVKSRLHRARKQLRTCLEVDL